MDGVNSKTVLAEHFKGRRIIIRQLEWSYGVPGITTHYENYYCGYVELFPEDYYYHHLSEAEACLAIHGGITWTPEYGRLDELPADGTFIGFDTARTKYTFKLQALAADCQSLIDQIIKRNEENAHGNKD